MTNSTDLLALEKRIVEVVEGSRPLDGELYRVEHGHEWEYGNGPLPEYTSSIDAALALVSRVLPDLCWIVVKWPDKYEVDVGKAEETESVGNATAPTPALAVILALVRALAHNPAVEK